MATTRRAGRSRLTLALLIFTSLAVLTLDFRDAGVVEGARRIAATVFSPLRGVARAVTEPFSNGWNGITDYGNLEAENDRLRERLEELEGSSVVEADATHQLQDLLEQLNIDWVGDIPRERARVISGPVSNFGHTIEIGKGSSSGIAEGMPVINGAGLVGRVVLVTSSSSTVQLITDPDFAVGVRVVPDGVTGTAKGNGRGEDLIVDTPLDAEAEVEAGVELTTSGEDRSNYPPSIPVATVRRTEEGSGGLTLDLIAEPNVDTDRLVFVSVLLRKAPR
ncbi:MAG: rod shape-determining protein MreC [Acidimicrobiales bacterium]|nr:rod shape-determining protein MreC [Acidimicrobiales bacterium]